LFVLVRCLQKTCSLVDPEPLLTAGFDTDWIGGTSPPNLS